jgi:hypothetical protein
MKTFTDPAAEFVPAVERVFGVPPRILDGSRAVLLGDVKLTLDRGERELWIVRVAGLGLEDWVACVEVSGDIERALREAKEMLGGAR